MLCGLSRATCPDPLLSHGISVRPKATEGPRLALAALAVGEVVSFCLAEFLRLAKAPNRNLA